MQVSRPSPPTPPTGMAAARRARVEDPGWGPHPSADALIEQLYAAHWHSLVRLAWLLVHDQAAAEDIVQDAFIATHRNAHQLRDQSAALGYLRRAVINTARSVHRHEVVVRRELTAEAGKADALGRGSAASAESDALAHLGDAHILAALRELPPRQREVLVLRYFADLSEAQIAEALGVAPGSVKAHAHRALAALRARMEDGS